MEIILKHMRTMKLLGFNLSHHLLSKCPLCPSFIHSKRAATASVKQPDSWRISVRVWLGEGKKKIIIIMESCRLLREECGETTPSSSHPSDVVKPLVTKTSTSLIVRFFFFFFVNMTSLQQTYSTKSSTVRIDRREYLHLCRISLKSLLRYKKRIFSVSVVLNDVIRRCLL